MNKAALFRGMLAFSLAFSLMASPALGADYSALRRANGGSLAEQHRFLPTTEKAVILTFGGLSREAPLKNLLEYMQQQGMRGTFFVTEREIARNSKNLALINSYGHDLALGLTPLKEGTFEDYCAQLERIAAALENTYGQRSRFVRIMSSGGDMAAMREAVSAMGYTLAGQGLNVVQSKHKEAGSPAEVMKDIFGRWTTSLNAGEIVYMRTDFYAHDDLAAEMLREIKEKKIDNIGYEEKGGNDSGYHTASLEEAASHSEYLYEQVNTAALPAEMQPEYGTGRVTEENFREEFFSRYIGAPQVSSDDRMLGFSRREMAKSF